MASQQTPGPFPIKNAAMTIDRDLGRGCGLNSFDLRKTGRDRGCPKKPIRSKEILLEASTSRKSQVSGCEL